MPPTDKIEGYVVITRESIARAIAAGWISGKDLITFLKLDKNDEFRLPHFSGDRKEDCALLVGGQTAWNAGTGVVVISYGSMCRAFPPSAYRFIHTNGHA